jgi:hypothetical protein
MKPVNGWSLNRPLLLITLVTALLSPPLYAESPKNLNIDISTPASLVAGESGVVQLTLTPHTGADYLTIDVSSSGALQASLSQQLDSDSTLTIDLPVSANNAANEGEITISVTAFSDSGLELFKRMTKLYGIEENDVVYLNASSPLYAKIAARDASGLQRKSDDVSSLFRATTVETNDPMPAAKRRASEVLVDQAFPIPAQKALTKPVTMTVNGTVLWTDSAGNTHPLPGAKVEIYDDDILGDDLLQTTTTNASGMYSVVVDHDDVVEGPDVYVKVLASSSVADVKPDTASGSTYFMQSTVHEDQADGSTLVVNLTADNSSIGGQAFSVHHALVAGGAYISLLNGSAPAKLTTRFPTTESTSLFNGSELHILQLDRWDWDVTLHEYGHYVMDAYNFEDNPGGSHSSSANLSTSRGSKDVGVRLAWGEGWPTFFAVSGLHQMGFASLGIPNVGDMQYQDTEDTTITNHLENDIGVGEDNELSVMTTLWDLVDAAADGEEIAMSPRSLFQSIKNSGATKIGDVWDALVAGKENEEKASHGKLFGLHKIAPEQLTPSDRSTLDTTTNFTWNKNGAGAGNPLNDNHVRFFASNFTTETHDASLGNVATYTPSAADVDAALSEGSLVRWVVTAKSTTAPATPSSSTEYWSDVRILNGASVVFVIDDTGSMSEEISGVSQALANYITALEGSLGEGEEAPTIHLLTFKDNVTHRLTTNDLSAMRDAVNGLSASGGGDCPEYSAHGLLAASKLVRAGGTILVATDASAQPGVDMAGVISDLRSRGVTVNTILSGDCSSETFKPSLLADAQGKPGFDEEGDEIGGSIEVPGTADGIDIVGDSIETASEINTGAILIGTIETSEDKDFFKATLEAGNTYTLALSQMNASKYTTLRLLDDEGIEQDMKLSGYASSTLAAYNETIETASFTPEADGTYYLELSSSSEDANYRVVISGDAFSALTASSVQLFSVISAETGGTFAKIDEVNSGDDSEYVNTIFNILRSTTEPAVITSSIRKLPRGARATVFFTGLNTNWGAATEVSFSLADGSDTSGVTISDIQILSPTSLSFVVDVAETADLVTLNLIAKTALGSGVEIAEGKGIITIETATTAASVLSLTPTRLIQGTTATLTIQGINTTFTDDMAVELGTGVTVDSVTRVSDTEATIEVTVAAGAPIGFRTLTAGSMILDDALLIGSESSISVISEISPKNLQQSQTTSVTVSGTNTHFETGVTTASFGDNVTVNSVTVNSPTEAIVNVTVDADAAIGFRNITLSTDGESATLLNGLYIDKQVLLMVPDVVGKTKDEAIATIEAAGLVVGSIKEEHSKTVASGNVISQTPTADSPVNAGSLIDLIISKGKSGGGSMSPWLLMLLGGVGFIAAARKRRTK